MVTGPGDRPVKVKVPKVKPKGALDVLPTKKGGKPKVYRPPVAKTVVAKADAQRRVRQSQVKDTKGNADRARAQQYLNDHPKILHPDKKKKGGLIAAVADVAPKVALASISPTVATLNAVTHNRIINDIGKAAKNAPKDTAELVTTAPTNLVKLGDTAIHNPKKLPKMLAQPYVDFAKNPEKALTDRPVSTALMLAPSVKVPGRIAGRALRIAGKQTLERVPAHLPGTALKEVRGASRDAVVNAIQKSRDAKRGAPLVTKKQIQRRADEFYDASSQKRAQMQAAAHRDAKVKAKALPKVQRKAAVTAAVEGAGKGAKTTIDRRFANEFGSTWTVDVKTGAILKPKNATEGALHPTRETAQRIADRLNAKPAMIPRGSKVRAAAAKVKLADNSPVPAEFTVRPVGKNEFAVVPKIAKDRLYGGGGMFGAQGHASVGSGKQVLAKTMRVSRRNLTQAVLPLSPKWLGGQVGEAGLRALVAGAGPLDVLRVHKVVKELNAHKPHLGDEMLMRIQGGQFGLTGTAREYAVGKRTLAEEFQNTSLETPAHIATKASQTRVGRGIARGWHAYSNAVFNSINGTFENAARKAMAGQALKDQGGVLMQRSLLGLSEKAIHDAANGLRGTEQQAALGRAVDRMYGQYQKFSPERRSLLLHWTPFLPWYLNVVTFLTKVLPVDHPVHAALIADANNALEDWRKAQHMSLLDPAHRPSFMLGGYPTKGGIVPVSRFLPFGAANDPAQSTADLLLPQFMGPVKNLAGVDWKWERLKHPGYSGREFNLPERVLRALVSGAESQIPGVSQAGRASGVTPKYVDHKAKTDSTGKALQKLVNPLVPIPNTDTATTGVKVTPVKIKPVKVKAIKVRPVKVK